MSHEKLMAQAIKECPFFDRDYTLDELEDYVYFYDVPTDKGKNAAVLAHFYYLKNSLYADELEVVWENDLTRVSKEKKMLLDFVKAVADGKGPTSTDAAVLLSKIETREFF